MRSIQQRIADHREYAQHSTMYCDWCDRQALWLLVNPRVEGSCIERACVDHSAMYGFGMVWHDLFPPYGALFANGGAAQVISESLASL